MQYITKLAVGAQAPSAAEHRGLKMQEWKMREWKLKINNIGTKQ